MTIEVDGLGVVVTIIAAVFAARILWWVFLAGVGWLVARLAKTRRAATAETARDALAERLTDSPTIRPTLRDRLHKGSP